MSYILISVGWFSHYEKVCLLEPHCLATITPKQLVYKYTTTITWKYGQLINRMSHQKIKELYYNCNLVTNRTPTQCNVHIVHIDIVNHV